MPHPILNHRLGASGYPNIGAALTGAATQCGSIADNASLSGGANLDFTLAAWVYPVTVSGNHGIMTKGNAAPNFEQIIWQSGSTSWKYTVSANGTAATAVTQTVPAPVLNTWFFVAGVYDGTNAKLSINATAFATAAFSTDIFNGTERFSIGSSDQGLVTWNGVLDCLGFWSSTRGNGGALSLAQIATLYNSGVGMAYRDLPPDMKTSLVSYWNMDGNLNDSHGTNHLTNNASVGFGAGKR